MVWSLSSGIDSNWLVAGPWLVRFKCPQVVLKYRQDCTPLFRETKVQRIFTEQAPVLSLLCAFNSQNKDIIFLTLQKRKLGFRDMKYIVQGNPDWLN